MPIQNGVYGSADRTFCSRDQDAGAQQARKARAVVAAEDVDGPGVGNSHARLQMFGVARI